MSRRDRLVVMAIGLPLMLRYGLAAARSTAKKQDVHD